MHRINSTLVAACLMAAGLYLLYVEIFVDPIAMMQIVAVGIFVTGVGALGFFTDFLTSVLRTHD
jgi:hypothetical protein